MNTEKLPYKDFLQEQLQYINNHHKITMKELNEVLSTQRYLEGKLMGLETARAAMEAIIKHWEIRNIK